MSGVNKVILLGRLGQDPELRYTPSGVPVCNLSVATSESFVDKNGQKQESTEWHKIVIWNKLAENCAKYLGKGRQVYLEGKLATRSWDDKDSGQKKYITEIVAQTVQFIGDGQQQGARQQQPQQRPQHASQPQGSDMYDPSWQQGYQPTPSLDDIPF